MNRRIIVVLLIFTGWLNIAKAATRLVPGTYSTIQAAINAAVNGDEVVVANGTYSGSGNIYIDFKGKAITVRSANGSQNCTINCNNAGNAFYFSNSETANSIVDGFTITGGYETWGGAIDCWSSSPTIKNCIITGNDAVYGGGIDCYFSSPNIINCVIKNNEATTYGGGISCFDSSPIIKNCVISGNIADYGGGIEINGSSSSPVIKNCLVINNTAGWDGGGFDCYDSNPVITNCTAVNNFDGYSGGGIYSNFASAPSIDNCIFWHNGHDLDGGATAVYSCIEDGDPGVGNISSDPLFRTGPSGDYYLSQKTAGQLQNSDCLDAGSDTAANLSLNGYTTRTDDVGDSGTVDMGYHYPLSGKPVVQYQLNSSVLNGHGSITPSGTANYKQFSEVRLAATANIYYKIKQWAVNGSIVPTNPADPNYPTDPNYPDEYIVTMNSNKTVTVEFEVIGSYQLTTGVKGLHGSISPPSGPQYQGYPVTLTAIPDSGYRVFGWYVNNVSVGVNPLDPNHYTAFMDSDKTVTVGFATKASNSILRVAVPTGHGKVSSGATYPFFGGTYPTGTVINLTAHPDPGYKLSQWIGTDNDSSIDVNNIVTVTYNKDVSVRFELATQYWLDTDIADANGDIISEPNGTIYPPDTWQDRDSDVLVTATPAYGYKVEKWWIDGVPTYPDPCNPTHYTVTMNNNRKVRVEFSRRPWLYTSVLPNSSYGTISPSSGPRNIEEVVKITATPASGYKVLNWVIDGTVVPLDPCSITDVNTQKAAIDYLIHDGDNHVDVNYGNRGTRTLHILYDSNDPCNPYAKGTLEPSGDTTYFEGQLAVITAHPKPGYKVKTWIIDDINVSVDPNLIIDPCHQTTEFHIRMNSDHDVNVEFWPTIYNKTDPNVRYNTIQEAIDAAQNVSGGGTVILSDGIYTGLGNYNLKFDPNKPPVIVRSENGPDYCIIDCNRQGSGFVFLRGRTDVNGQPDFKTYINDRFGVDGLTIKNGSGVKNNGRGGGLYYEGRFYDTNAPAEPYPSPTVKNCIITNNTATSGGGVCFWANKISKVGDVCEPPENGWPVTPKISDCVISNNSAGDGGGIYSNLVIPRIVSCRITNNSASESGGGIYGVFSAAGGTSEQKGGIINCLIASNRAGSLGGGIYFDRSISGYEVSFCTIMYNTGVAVAGKSTGGISLNKGSCIVSHTVIGRSAGDFRPTWIWGNTNTAGDDIYGVGGNATVTYSCIENGADGEGNISSNPIFVSGPFGDFYLSQSPGNPVVSPCVGVGEPSALRDIRSIYGISTSITTNIMGTADSGLPDFGYHYPSYYPNNPPILIKKIGRTVILQVTGNGTLNYSYHDEHGVTVQKTLTSSSSPVTFIVLPGTNISLTAVPNSGNRVLRWTGTVHDKYSDAIHGQDSIIDNVSLTNNAVIYSGTGTVTVTLDFEQTYKRTINAWASGSDNPPYTYVGMKKAIFAARDGDEVIVHNGTYSADNFYIIGKNIKIRSEHPDDPCCIAATVLDGAGYDWICAGFTVYGDYGINGGKGNCVIEGFTIKNNTRNEGKPGTPTTCSTNGTDGSTNTYSGTFMSGIALVGDHKVYNCVIKDCSMAARDGGDGSNGCTGRDGGRGGDGQPSGAGGITVMAGAPLIENCRIENCVTYGGDGGKGGNGGLGASGGRGGMSGRAMGGGINIGYSHFIDFGYSFTSTNQNPTFKKCVVKNCKAIGGQGGNGGNVGADGPHSGFGGLYAYDQNQDWPVNRSSYGGAVYCDSTAAATFIDCEFIDCGVNGSISGVGGSGATPTRPIAHTLIPGFGGAIYCHEGSTLVLQGCTIQDCNILYQIRDANITAVKYDYTGYGGAICAEDVNRFSIMDCNIINNSAPVGGGLYALAIGKTCLIEDCNIKGNKSFIGGGLYIIDSAYVNVTKCDITNNLASQASHPSYSLPIVSEPVPDPNDPNDPNTPEPPAPQPDTGLLFGAGGGIYCFTSDIFIADCNISENTSNGSGGGLYIGGIPESISPLRTTAKPSIWNCLISKNTGARDGGGVSCDWYTKTFISNCTIVGNKLTGKPFTENYGGGLYCSYESDVNVIDSIIWGNWGTYGSQIAVDNWDHFVNNTKLNVSYSNVEMPNITGIKSLDLVFCIDTTLSMDDDIGSVKASAADIIDGIAKVFADYRIALVDYRDFNTLPYGFPIDYPYKDDLAFSANRNTVEDAINALQLGAGADYQESVYSGLMHSFDGTSLGNWRTSNTVNKIIILMGDAPPHDPEPFTGYTLSDISSAAAAKSIRVYPILIGDANDTRVAFEKIAKGTQGTLVMARDANEVVDAIMTAINLILPKYGIYKDKQGCEFNWNSDSNSWYPNSHNISTDPLFTDGYYLSQIASGQSSNSSCVDTGSKSADLVGMYRHTTRTDWKFDTGVVDRGYHYVLLTMEGDFDVDGDVDFEDLAIFTEHYLDTGCTSPGWCGGTDIDRDGNVDLQDYAKFQSNIGHKESVPPVPSPMTFEVLPDSVYGQTYIAMTASKAKDNYTPVQQIEYYFQRTNASGVPDGHIRDWSTSRIFTDSGLSSDATFGYRVKAHDRAGNETQWSQIKYATVGRDNKPPIPDPMKWLTTPYAFSSKSIKMTAKTATDESGGVEYYFECITTGGHSSGWIVTPTYEDKNLEPNTAYTYRVRARDRFDNRTGYSATNSATTFVLDPNEPVDDNTPPSPAPSITGHSWSYDGVNWHLILTSTVATDASGVVQYKFTCTTNSSLNSQWQTSNIYDVTVGAFKQNLIWQVKARDGSDPPNETSLSAGYYATK